MIKPLNRGVRAHALWRIAVVELRIRKMPAGVEKRNAASCLAPALRAYHKRQLDESEHWVAQAEKHVTGVCGGCLSES
jgi:hypothetical protein